MRLRYLLPLLLAASTSWAEPVPFLTQSGHYALDWTPERQTLEIESASGSGTYDVTGCVYGRRMSGIFALYFQGLEDAHVLQHCQTESGERLSIYAPATDPKQPVFEIYAFRASYLIGPNRLVISTVDRGKQTLYQWLPDRVTRAPVPANTALRRLPEPFTASDQGLDLLDSQMRSPEGRSALIGAQSTWPGWEQLLRGGWSSTYKNGRLIAYLPADLANWPGDLDPDAYLYADRSGALLRAAPHISAPVLHPIRRVILQSGPGLPGEEALEASGWRHVCPSAGECGFARAEDLRPATGPRAIFSRDGDEAPWKFERIEEN